MTQIDEKQIEEIVSQILTTLQQEGAVSPASPVSVNSVNPLSASTRSGVFATVDEAVAAAKTAQAALVALGFAKRRELIEAIKQASLENAKRLAEFAAQETQMGNPAHKVMKNEGAVHLSPGVEDLHSEAVTGDRKSVV